MHVLKVIAGNRTQLLVITYKCDPLGALYFIENNTREILEFYQNLHLTSKTKNSTGAQGLQEVAKISTIDHPSYIHILFYKEAISSHVC